MSRRARLGQRERLLSIVAACGVLPVAIVPGAPGEYATRGHAAQGNDRTWSRGRRPDRTSTDVPSRRALARVDSLSLLSVVGTTTGALRSDEKLARNSFPVGAACRSSRLSALSLLRGETTEHGGKAHDVGTGWRSVANAPRFKNCKETTGIGRLRYCCSCM